MNETSQITPERIGQMYDYLESRRIPVHIWNGENNTKTVEDLLVEIGEGEAIMTESHEGYPLKKLFVAVGDVYHGKYQLFEEAQVFDKDGKISRRFPQFGAIAEKAKAGEDIVESVIRGLGEELGLSIGLSQVSPNVERIVEERVSRAYPGLRCEYNIGRVRVDLTEDQYRPNNGFLKLEDGTEIPYAYTEEQPGKKTTYFGWRKIVQD